MAVSGDESYKLAQDCKGSDCPCSKVFADITSRLQLLEDAFRNKDNVSGFNESDSMSTAGIWDESLSMFRSNIDNITNQYAQMEKRMSSLAFQAWIDGKLQSVVHDHNGFHITPQSLYSFSHLSLSSAFRNPKA